MYDVQLPLVGWDSDDYEDNSNHIKNAMNWCKEKYPDDRFPTSRWNLFDHWAVDYIDGVAKFTFRDKDIALEFKLRWVI